MSLSAVEIVPSQDETMSHPEPGLRRQVMSYSPGMMLVRHRMQKGWVGARHSHPHEQLVYIVSGHLSFQHPGGVFDAKAPCTVLMEASRASRTVLKMRCSRSVGSRLTTPVQVMSYQMAGGWLASWAHMSMRTKSPLRMGRELAAVGS